MNTSIIDAIKNQIDQEDKIEDIKETHISYVIITKLFAYKFKKEVDFNFLNFISLQSRKHYCELEMELNTRGARDLYLDVVEFKLDSKIVDYAVKMNRFEDSALFINLLKSNKLQESDITNLVKSIVRFQGSNEQTPDFGEVTIIQSAFDENFSQTKKYIGTIIDASLYRETKDKTYRFFDENKNLFKDRVDKGKIRNNHGDLHFGNICYFKNKIQLFDCIEFKQEWRKVDNAYDIAYVLMDLEINERSLLARRFLEEYIEMTGDEEIIRILPIYKSRQSYVRAKVGCFRLEQLKKNSSEYSKLLSEVEKYLIYANKCLY